jgi:hypothetical protein
LWEGSGLSAGNEAEMVIGYDEAKMMREEGLFRQMGDELSDFF